MLTADQVTKTGIWYDNTGNGRAIAMYSLLCYASAADVAAANAAGIRGVVGDIVVVPPITANINTDKIAGIALNSAFPGEPVTMVIGGIAEVMVSGAYAWDKQDAWWFCGLAETRTSLQTPLTSLSEMLIPLDARVPVTYQLALASRTAVAPASGGANAPYYPLGYALDASTNKYDVIRFELDLGLKYA